MILGMENIIWEEMKSGCLHWKQWFFVAYEGMEEFYNK